MKTKTLGALILSSLITFGGCNKSDDSSSAGGGQVTTHVVTVTKAGTGAGSVVSAPAGIDCGSDCSETVLPGTVLVLTPTAEAGSTFAGWSGGGCSGTGGCSVTANADVSVVATFTSSVATQKNLTVSKSGAGSGTVTSSPSGINCGADCSENYNQGTTVALTASPGATSQFNGWSGGGCSGTGPCSVTLGSDTVVTAEFAPLPPSTYALTVSRQGTGGGTVVSSPAGINCGSDCSETYTNGAVVTLTPTPDATSTFGGWTGACTGTGACVVTMSQARTVTATFTKITYLLSVNRTGTGTGTVTSAPVGIDCGSDCSETYDVGTSVTLTAVPSATADFTGWSGECAGMGACVVTLSESKSVEASFTSKHLVTVNKTGSGLGSVISNPAGLDCGLDCSEYFSHGAVINLTAAADPGYKFTGWSGDCSGTGSCSVVVTESRTVSASFAPDYNGEWWGETVQGLPMGFSVANDKVTKYHMVMSVSGCGVISSTVTYGTPLSIVGNSFTDPSTYSYIKGTFNSVNLAAGTIKQNLSSMCGVSVTFEWDATRSLGSLGATAWGPPLGRAGNVLKSESKMVDGNWVEMELREKRE